MRKRQNHMAFQMVAKQVQEHAEEHEVECKCQSEHRTYVYIDYRPEAYNDAIQPFRAFRCRPMIEQARKKPGGNRPFEQRANRLFTRERFKKH